ncbi:MAG TPA: glycoside hydrolase family 3 C-terminal domain-containing protein [Eubacteriales bacterium]|nr:glycoside hydrolase family 3 C-terminal domain-containing protein [Eubacteriales bacterium]
MNFNDEAKKLVSQMTLQEKTRLLSGADSWRTKPVERLGLSAVAVSDGPHGLRKEAAGEGAEKKRTLPATCFPTASLSACSFDRDLLRSLGSAIAEECRAEDVSVILGPGLNCKRSPLCGRNFEYFSEDPVVSGELASAFVQGVQSQGVGACVKHFALNNQELRRLIVDSVADERAMFELYLSSFERVIKSARPWTVMCSYNRVKGLHASENKWLLTDVLRNQWGFDGLVMSDWGAVNDRNLGVSAGLDLEMPYVDSYRDDEIAAAVERGELKQEDVDRCAERVCALVLRANAERKPLVQKHEAHHAFAREAAARSAVLLKNEDALLPLKPGASVAVIGTFAKTPRYQGAGSSKVVPVKLDSALEELQTLGIRAEYADGYDVTSDEPDEALLREACEAARGKDAAILFIGLPDRYESEGFDRAKLDMPKNHIELVRRVAQANPNVVAVVACGSVVDMAWESGAKSILLTYLGGEAVGGAAADLITGRRCPSGKLPESWPLTLADSPSFAYFPGYPHTVEYRESIFVGYRYFDTAEKPVRYPFGYGLSYTSFAYSNLRLSGSSLSAGETLEISCDITNTGSVTGGEVVQLYVSHRSDVMFCAEQELKGFEKVLLHPGETKTVSFTLDRRDISYYNTKASGWRVEGGEYEIRISASSRDIRLRASVRAQADGGQTIPDFRKSAPCYYDLSNGVIVPDDAFSALLGRPIPQRSMKKGDPFTRNSTLAEAKHTLLGRILVLVGKRVAAKMKDDEEAGEMVDYLVFESPLRMLTMGGSGFGPKQVDAIVTMLNGRFFKGLKGMRKPRSR